MMTEVREEALGAIVPDSEDLFSFFWQKTL